MEIFNHASDDFYSWLKDTNLRFGYGNFFHFKKLCYILVYLMNKSKHVLSYVQPLKWFFMLQHQLRKIFLRKFPKINDVEVVKYGMKYSIQPLLIYFSLLENWHDYKHDNITNRQYWWL